MGRKRNRHRLPRKLDLGHSGRLVRQADDQETVRRRQSSVQDVLPTLEPGTPNRYQILAVCGFLLLAVALVFGQTIRHKFVNYDDHEFVYENPHIAPGLTGQGIVWAFTHFEGHYWIPLARISSMLDCQLYGLSAGGHHLTNVLLHTATTILLFLIFRRMTGRFWPSALVAALFAVHPLHVESVAWVTERKDVLSGLFFALTLGTYVWYVQKPFSVVRYLLLVAVFALGLMAKPMLVTLPFVLLLLDYWPLGRMTVAVAEEAPDAKGKRSGGFSLPARVLFEKAPLLLLVAVFCTLTSWTMRELLTSNEYLPLWPRIANALVSYVAYLGQFFCPVSLAVFYPHLGLGLAVWKVLSAVVVLACISAGAVACWRRYPYLLMGWLWYLGMLVPVIGLVQLGSHAMADRFTYLPHIGLYIALAWGVTDVCRSSTHYRWVCSVTCVLVLLVVMGCAWRQTSFWSDSETLWTHTLACTTRNRVAHCNLGNVLAGRGQIDSAIAHYQKALEIMPDFAEAHNNLAVALAGRGEVDSAIAHHQRALEIKPDFAEAHNNLALAPGWPRTG